MKNQGCFNEDNTEYIITDMKPKRPWFNYLWNDNFISQINQFGMGASWHYTNDGVRTNLNCKGTPSDLSSITDNRIIFIKEESHTWAANRNYKNDDFKEFKTIVGQGVSEIISEYRNIKTSFKILIPENGAKECWQITVQNTSNENKEFSLYPYSNSSISALAHTACSHADYNEKLNAIIMENINPSFDNKLTTNYFMADKKPDFYETTNRRFAGTYGELSSPEAIKKDNLASTGTSFDWLMIFAMQFKLNLKPNEKVEINIVNGLATSVENINENPEKFSKNFETEIKKLHEKAVSRNKNLEIETDNENLNSLTNSWLKQQISLGKTWGRVYGKGFRDIMQDCTAVVSFDSVAAKQNILACLHYQYPDGNTLRQWNGIWNHPYRDGASWMFAAITGYIKETNDYSILEEEIPFYESEEKGTVLEHCHRGMNFLLNNLGENGLCLWGGGDWNDSLDRAGLEGKGESVWLSQATVLAATTYEELLLKTNNLDEAKSVSIRKEKLKENINTNAWEKDHYLMGINDKGDKVGSYENKQGKMFLNTQSWAVLSETAKKPQELMDFVEKELSCEYGFFLAKPAYDKGDITIGNVTYMDKGCCENGAVYNHAVAFKAVADCKLQRAEEAYATIIKLLPGNHDSGVEPYCVTNQYLGVENPYRAGEANGSWITGTAGWTYRCITEYIIGIQADYDGLRITPCLPKALSTIKATRTFRGKEYKIKISKKENEYEITVDGKTSIGESVLIEA